MKKNKLYFVAMLLVGLVAFASCKKNNPDTPEEPQTGKFALTITPVSIGSVDATFKVTPTEGNEKKYYVAYIFDKESFDERGGKEGIHEWQMGWWKRNGEVDFHANMMAELTKGEKVFNVVSKFPELVMLKWDCDYVFYAYGVDTVNGEQITEVFTHEFHTPKGSIQSDNQFTVTLGNITHDEVVANITTTNNDPYMVRCETKSFVDSYRNKPETELLGGQKPLDAMIYEIMKSNFNKVLDEEGVGRFPVYQGNKQFNRNDQILLSPNREYTMIIVGFDKGLTTTIKYVDFKTTKAPVEEP